MSDDAIWVQTNITRLSLPCCFPDSATESSRLVCPKFWAAGHTLIYTFCQELMNSVGGVMAANPCPFHNQTSWWSDTLQVTIIRLWLHSIRVFVLFCSVGTDATDTFQNVFWMESFSAITWIFSQRIYVRDEWMLSLISCITEEAFVKECTSVWTTSDFPWERKSALVCPSGYFCYLFSPKCVTAWLSMFIWLRRSSCF
jgi:hypothetical protein